MPSMACDQGHAVFLPPRKGGPTQNSPMLEEEPELPRLQTAEAFLFLWQPGAALSTSFVEDCGLLGRPGSGGGRGAEGGREAES